MKERDTEKHIKQTAKEIFFGKGKINAKMHEIAKEAGINRALLHYYFRSRENLFAVVLQEALEESFHKMFDILLQEEKFEVKIETAIHHIIDSLSQYPFMEAFIISEINKDPSNAPSFKTIKSGRTFTNKFLKEIASYIKKNKLPAIGPEDFIVNMMALCAYPASTKPIIQNILGYNEKAYKKFLLARKNLVTELVLQRKTR
jgi:TetR/AcrR family transcriptional regulator